MDSLMSKQKQQPETETGFIHALLNFPRITRIIIAGVFALSLTLALSPIVDRLYEQYFYSEETLILPAIISAVLGVLMYVLGWFAIVGVNDEKLIPSKAVVGYLLLGMMAVLLVLAWTVSLVIRGGII
jgi:uncharacterized membrane protein YwzB